MQVYGDPHIEVDLARTWRELASRITRAPAEPSVDTLRELVVACGQVEQAAHDALCGKRDHRGHPFVARLHAMTDQAARAFHAMWVRGAPLDGTTRWQAPKVYIHALKRDIIARPESVRAVLKVPEGFAYNGLFPEQYCAAAWAWIAKWRQRVKGTVLIIGVRSAGTTLSAIVSAALESAGMTTERITVRPLGPSFARELTLEPSVIKDVSAAIVVDEGPGLSGSSLAAVGLALEKAGLSRHAMAFICAHDRGPGPKAGNEVRAFWKTITTFSMPVTSPIFAGRSLHDHLANELTKTMGVSVEPLPDDDWRKLAYVDPRDWPPSPNELLSPRYRVRTPTGAIALEFGGLATIDGRTMAAQAIAQYEQRTFAGYAPAPIGIVAGYVARHWLEGVALRARDIEPALLVSLSHYLTAMAGAPLDTATLAAAQLTRASWAYQNLAEALGDSAAQRAAAYVEAGSVLPLSWTRAAFEYDLAPQHWMRTRDGAIAKIGGPGHARGSTVVGVQPVLWDVVSLLVEWNLGRSDARAVVGAIERELGASLPRPALRAFMLAYIAFKIGELHLGREGARDAAEADRYAQAIAAYCQQVDRLLQ
jgi:hypothetical protein